MASEVDTNLIIENLTELLQNTVNMTSVFYDIFINPVPMDVVLTQFNQDGQLITISVPNRAKDMQRALIGIGNPEGSVSAAEGTLFVDQTTQTVYVKTVGNETNGWKIILTEEGVYTYVKNYLVEGGYLDEAALEQYLTNHSYTTEARVAEIIANSTSVAWLNTLPSSGTILLEDQKSYKVEATGDIAFVLPTITDLTKLHRIFIQFKVTNGSNNVSLGTNYFFNKINPDFTIAGIYDIEYEYDNLNNVWVCRTEIKGLGSYISIPALYDKVNSLAPGGGGEVIVDSDLSPTSTNPVQNAVITNALNARGTLVTSIGPDSTDLEYPSAKCIYDLIGNLESILDTIIAGNS